jgi:hypothetical protein
MNKRFNNRFSVIRATFKGLCLRLSLLSRVAGWADNAMGVFAQEIDENE